MPEGRGLLAGAGAVVAGVLASLCCVGPLLFVTVGVGAGLASTFEPLRPLFTALMVLFLGVGFYLAYGRRPSGTTRAGGSGGGIRAAKGAAGASCRVPRSRRRDRILLWTAAALAAAAWTFIYWSEWVLS